FDVVESVSRDHADVTLRAAAGSDAGRCGRGCVERVRACLAIDGAGERLARVNGEHVVAAAAFEVRCRIDNDAEGIRLRATLEVAVAGEGERSAPDRVFLRGVERPGARLILASQRRCG